MLKNSHEFRTKFEFENLFILDLANNHQGDLEHAKNIISQCASAVRENSVRAAMKFQFRDLPHFVHSDERENSSNKHVPRFLSTHLGWDGFKVLLDLSKQEGLLTCCTPFDEASVDRIVDMGFDIIKVASCSARDWPLLEKVVNSGLPIIASTGGLEQHEVDDLVSFFRHRACDFALMHCVSIYPTPDEDCNLGNISEFVTRYPNVTIGWSTHEDPSDIVHVGLAQALGANMFERHVGIETEKYPINKYSASPEQVADWLTAYQRAKTLIGSYKRLPATDQEKQAIDGLKRGVFAKKSVPAGQEITRDDVYFAFPFRDNQIASGEWVKGITCSVDLRPDQPLNQAQLEIPKQPKELILKRAVHKVKAMLAKAKIPLSQEFSTEYSHHYGVDRFEEVGAVLITVVNRDYAKKILVQLPGQRHPLHFHKLKEETFIVLHGDLTIELDSVEKALVPGDTLTVRPGVWHSFYSENGCIFEEISSTAFKGDSVYRDPAINELAHEQRKTKVDHWGRFQLSEALNRG